MNAPRPHFLLFSESNRRQTQGQWRFVLQSIDGADQLEAADEEPSINGERLELLAVVRGLEAIPQPARVTLVTPSKYVNRGMTRGLEEWRTNGWQWEHFGEMVPVKNRDLWQRIDHALTFHQIECRTWRFDLPHAGIAGPLGFQTTEPAAAGAAGVDDATVDEFADAGLARVDAAVSLRQALPVVAGRDRQRGAIGRMWLACKRFLYRTLSAWQLTFAQWGTRLLPLPWFE
jgi:ribonuclease HI